MLLGWESSTKAHPDSNSHCCQLQLGTAWVLPHRLWAEPQPDPPALYLLFSILLCLLQLPSSRLFPPAGLWKCLLPPPAPSLSFSPWRICPLAQQIPDPAPPKLALPGVSQVFLLANSNSLRASRFGCWFSSWIFHLPKSKRLLVEAFKN